MAYDPGAIDATLAAAVGDDPMLIVELRLAFRESAARALAAMKRAPDPEAWQAAASRLKGLSASFGAVRLMALASEATARAPGDADMLRALHRTLDRV